MEHLSAQGQPVIQAFEVEAAQEGIRLDKFLSLIYPDLSRSYFHKLIKSGQVLAADAARKPSYEVKEGELVTVQIPPAVQVDIQAEDIPLDILYEDHDILVVNKPKGMVVHPAAGNYCGTLVNAVMYHCKGQLSGINGEIRPGIVHRIDKDTTGSLIVCKNDTAHVHIASQIKAHSLTRRYRGIVIGRVADDVGIVNANIGRDPKNRKKMASDVPGGRHAVTHYRVLERFLKHTYMEFELETGRTHQIRVHMASIGHPLLADPLYGHTKCSYQLQGQCLHAMTLGFIHPVTGKYIEVTAPLPEYFQKLLDSGTL